MTEPTTEIEFWYEFASPYAYLAAARIDRLVAGAPVRVAWRPLLLGPIFQRRPGHASPFQDAPPAEAAYRRRDVERFAARWGIPLAWPRHYPRASLLGARVALLGGDEGWASAFSRALYRASFVVGGEVFWGNDRLDEAVEWALRPEVRLPRRPPAS